MNRKTEPKTAPGFLSRLSRFIRHPTTDWSQTQFQPGERPDPGKEAAQRREAQKIDRAAVLIRNREFDVLRREMRNRKSQSADQLEGLSIPSTQQPTPLRAASRQHTLHKIDAIERQIQNEHKRQLSPTLPDGLIAQSGLAQIDFAASTLRPGSARRSAPRLADSRLRAPTRPQTTLPFAPQLATQPLTQWGHTVPPLPAVIELASFDFAEGRDAQVESQLLTGMQTEAGLMAKQQVFQALLDFYWATGQTDKLQSRSLDYVRDYGQTPAPRPELGPLQAANLQTVSFFLRSNSTSCNCAPSSALSLSPPPICCWTGLRWSPLRKRSAARSPRRCAH
ncbi:MAG: hypothetical protein ACP5QB_12800 [Thiomonas sp.]